MPNYVPVYFPCPHCNRKLRKLSIGYICDRCRSVFAETMTAKKNGVAEIIETHERVVVGITDYPTFTTITQGEQIEEAEADQEDADGSAEGQEGVLT